MSISFENRIYEVIKDNRNVPDETVGTCVGILSPKETVLFDAIISAYRHQSENHETTLTGLVSGSRDVATGDLHLEWQDGTRTLVASNVIAEMPVPLTGLRAIIATGMKIEKFGSSVKT